MKKKLLLIATLVLVVVAVGCWAYFSNSTNQYPITKPYVYPSEEEIKKAWVYSEQIKVCSIPDEIIAQMSTDALLEAYLDYPFINFWRFSTHTFFYSDWFEDLKTNHHFGMAELMEREDVCESILKRYKSIKLYKKPIDQNLSWDERLARYPKEIQGAIDMFFLELLAAQFDLDDGDRVRETLRKTIEKKVAEKSNYDAYIMPQATIYQRALDNERSKQNMPGGYGTLFK